MHRMGQGSNASAVVIARIPTRMGIGLIATLVIALVATAVAGLTAPQAALGAMTSHDSTALNINQVLQMQDASGTSSGSGTAESEAASSSNTGSTAPTQNSDVFLGDWTMVAEMTGESITDLSQSVLDGTSVVLTLADDGTYGCALSGYDDFEGSWTSTADGEGTIDIGDTTFDVAVENGKLCLSDGEYTDVYVSGNLLAQPSKHAESFTGTWVVDTVTMADGRKATAQDGSGSSVVLELANDGTVRYITYESGKMSSKTSGTWESSSYLEGSVKIGDESLLMSFDDRLNLILTDTEDASMSLVFADAAKSETSTSSDADKSETSTSADAAKSETSTSSDAAKSETSVSADAAAAQPKTITQDEAYELLLANLDAATKNSLGDNNDSYAGTMPDGTACYCFDLYAAINANGIENSLGFYRVTTDGRYIYKEDLTTEAWLGTELPQASTSSASEKETSSSSASKSVKHVFEWQHFSFELPEGWAGNYSVYQVIAFDGACIQYQFSSNDGTYPERFEINIVDADDSNSYSESISTITPMGVTPETADGTSYNIYLLTSPDDSDRALTALSDMRDSFKMF